MPARRFFIEGTHRDGDTVDFDASDAHKIVRVLRLSSGDAVCAVDSGGTEFEALLSVEGARVQGVLRHARRRSVEAPVRLTIAQAVPKGAKMDFVVEKLAELGVERIVPLVTERTVARDPGSGKVERWRRLSRAAAQQSGSTSILAVDEITTLDALIGRFPEFDRVLLPWESAELLAPKNALPPLLPQTGSVLALIGPEGGFAQTEAELARQHGAAVVSLGPRIYRTETAGLVLAAIVTFLTQV